MSERNSISATLGLAALLALTAAEAGTFTISPLRVDFAGTTGTAALTVRNEDAAPVVVQAQGMAWSQEAGKDALAPSRDLLVSPAVSTVPPGGSQLVRVALRRAVDPARELSYRLTLQEVPQQASPDFTRLQVALRLSLPVFVAPAAAAEPLLSWAATFAPDGSVSVSARNDGSAHARIQGFAIKTTDGTSTIHEQPGLVYVLPGSTRAWAFDQKNNVRSNAGQAGAPLRPGQYRLEGTTDRGAFATELILAAD